MIRRYRRELSAGIALAFLLLLLAVRAPSFFKADQLRAVLVNNTSVLIAAIGMTLVIVSRHIDISIGSQLSICGVVAGLLAKMGLSMPWVAGGTLLAGAGMGAINGVLIAGLSLPSIVVTLATLVILRESLRWARQGEFVRDLPDRFQWFGMPQATGQWLLVSIAFLVLVAFAWGMRYLFAGRAVYATGSDQEAARLAGIHPRRVVFGVFVCMGALAGLAALLSAVRFPQVDPSSGSGMELQVIAAVVVGGTAVAGGRGTMIGTLAGVALLGTIAPALQFFHTQPQWEKALQGLIILIAVASDSLARKER
jgi:rhamnose transport system permease protein